MGYLGVAVALSTAAAGFAAAGDSCPAPHYPQCCEALEDAGLASKVSYPSEESYEASVESYWSVVAQLRPTCILQPTTAEDVSLAVKTLTGKTTRLESSCQFAIRSGGHTTWAGAANIKDGVTIDLSLMNSTTYDAEESITSIEPGATWDEVYEVLDKIGVSTAGGSAAGVGVGGLTLGGGNTFYSPRRGFVCDNVANFEVVLANGDIVNANPETNTDLFQALKGGSNNFGIVTRIDLYAFEGEGLWGGIVVYPANTAKQQIPAFVNFNDRMNDDPYGSAYNIYQYSSETGQNLIMNVYEYTKPEASPPIFDEYLSIPGNISDSMRITNMTSLSKELTQPEGLRTNFWTLTFQNDERVIQKMVELHNGLISQLGNKTASTFAISNLLEPIPTIIAERSVAAGGNILGLDRFEENLVVLQHYLTWDRAEEDEMFMNTGDSFIDDLSKFAKEIGKDNEFIYLNYAFRNQDPLKSYGKENVGKMKKVAKKYDPTGVFQKQVPGGFKISDVHK